MTFDLIHFSWRIAPYVFPAAYAWAVWASMRVWDVVVTYEPGWTMPPELSFATWHMAIAAAISLATWIVSWIDPEARPRFDMLPVLLCMIPAALITLCACLLAFPLLLAAARQPAAYIPSAGVIVACPWWWFALKEGGQ